MDRTALAANEDKNTPASDSQALQGREFQNTKNPGTSDFGASPENSSGNPPENCSLTSSEGSLSKAPEGAPEDGEAVATDKISGDSGDENYLYIYAIARGDLDMPAGKLSAQTGHAYTDALFDCLDKDPERAMAYRRNGAGGSKVTLVAKNLGKLERAYREALEAGLPCALIIDRDHILPPHFDGSPIVTAVGIGPCTKAEARPITKRYRCA